MTVVNAYAAMQPGSALGPFTYELGDLSPEQVDIQVESCGICHSDLSMLQNDWGNAKFPLVPGHEVVGTISAVGSEVKGLEIGQRVGLGWFSGSCKHCHTCLSGDHNLCGSGEETIVNRHGGFADRVRCNWEWAIPIPEGVDPLSAGPLFCGGITVFNPIVQLGIKPTDRVGVIGIGGLGHLALQFLNKWGCEVTAFTSSPSKAEEAKKLGAHRIINSRDPSDIGKHKDYFDLILNTANVTLDWNAYIDVLGPKGHLHTVGAVLEPLPVPAFSLIMRQRSVSGTPLGSPATIQDMLAFCARHGVKPVTEVFSMDDVNDAIQHLKEGKARYRIVLKK